VVTLALVGTMCTGSKRSGSAPGSTSPGVTAPPADPLKIGFFGALTGPNAQFGINEYNAARLAVDQHNALGATQVQLVQYDSQGDPSVALQLAQRVIADKVVVVIGPAFSDESARADPIFEQAGIVNVTASATGSKLAENGWKYWHRVVGSDNSQGAAAAKYIARKLSARSVAVIDDNEDYSSGIADIVRSSLKSSGVTVTVSDHIDKNTLDYSPIVDSIKAANVDAIFYGGYYSEGGRLLKQLRDAGVTVPWVSDDGAAISKLVDIAGAAAAEGALMTCPCGDMAGNPKAVSFVAGYKASTGVDPGTYSAEAYDATNIVLKAIDAGKTTARDIDDYLSTANYDGLTRTIKFDAKGQVSSSTVNVFEVKGGKVTFDGSVDQLVAS
jgi:branched-chain amino acid transport system substrate-binding protein